MRKENTVNEARTGEPIPRLTRARAAAIRSSATILCSGSEDSKQQDQKKNCKRAASDQKNKTTLVQAKKRAVLKDVTNVCCTNSYKTCLPAAMLLKKNGRQVSKAPIDIREVAPAVSDTKRDQKSENTEPQSVKQLDKKVDCQISMENSGTGIIPKLDKQLSGLPPKPPKVSKKAAKLNLCTELEFIDIDSDEKDPQLCSIYAVDIYRNLRAAELMRRPSYTFMEKTQRDVSLSMRSILVDWLVEVCEEYKLVADTLYLTVYLIDLFLSQHYIKKQKLQLLGITCMLIASKYEEICPPRVEEFCFITDNTYTKDEVITMESEVLNKLSFQLSAPTAKSFLRRFLRAAQASCKSPNAELEFLGNYLAELSLLDYSFLKFIPSMIAASVVFLARWTLDQSSHPWNSTLEHYTNYKASDLKTAVLALWCLQRNTSDCPLNAIRSKYKKDQFKNVAALVSPELQDTLFEN